MFYKYNEDKLAFEQVKTMTFIKGGVILFAITLAIGFGVVPRAAVNNLTPEEKTNCSKESTMDFSESKLVDKIKHLNLNSHTSF